MKFETFTSAEPETVRPVSANWAVVNVPRLSNLMVDADAESADRTLTASNPNRENPGRRRRTITFVSYQPGTATLCAATIG